MTQFTNLTTDYTSPTALVEETPYNNGDQAPIYLLIDWENQTIDVDTYYEPHSVPMDIFNKLRSRIRLPNNINAAYLHDEITDLIPKIEEIYAGYESIWNGHNWIGTLTDSSQEALYDLTYTIDTNPDHYFTTDETISLWDAADWFNSPIPELTPFTTPEELTELAEEYHDAAHADYAVIRGGTDAIKRHFQDQIDEMLDSQNQED